MPHINERFIHLLRDSIVNPDRRSRRMEAVAIQRLLYAHVKVDEIHHSMQTHTADKDA